MRHKEVRQFVEYVRSCEGWRVSGTGTGPFRFHGPNGALVFMHGTVNAQTLANRRALLHRHGLPRPERRG